MKLTATTFVSLDGVSQAPGGPTEDPSDGFTLGGWVIPFVDAENFAVMGEVFGRADAFLFGRRTYEIFSAFWPNVTDPDDIVASRFNTRPKHVVSRTLTTADWDGSTIVDGDLRTAVEALKTQPGDELQVHGSCKLVAGLHDLGLIDEHRLLIFPVILGSGRPLFPHGMLPKSFELVSSDTTPGGITILVLRPRGGVALGDVGIEDGAEVMRT
jgi:dihydrofolate reductase